MTSYKCPDCGATITYEPTTKQATRNSMRACRTCTVYIGTLK